MIEATIIADSVSAHTNQRITTFELEYPQFIHAQLLIHRQFSITDNSIFNHDITIDEMIEQVEADNIAYPVYWGKNQSSMQAKQEVPNRIDAASAWQMAALSAVDSARDLQSLGLHKQIVSRVLAPFQITKAVVTATSFDSLFGLRCHKDVQPEIKWLADLMYQAMKESCPMKLYAGEWHTPYVEPSRNGVTGELLYHIQVGERYSKFLTKEQAIKISCSCVAQVGHPTHDTSIEKALAIYNELINGGLIYANAFEHCATPIDIETTSEGITHFDINDIPYSGNFANWAQI